MELTLIRHAESKHFFNRIIAGPLGCQGLTDHGMAQARVLAQRLRETGELDDCQVLLTSPVMRTRQTAAILAQALPHCRIEEEVGLCELLPGEADGLPREEAGRRFGSFDLQSNPHRPIAPGGESWADFIDRARSTMQDLSTRFEGQSVAAVTHAGFIVVSLLVLFDIPRPGTGAWLDPDFTSLTEWQSNAGRWSLVKYNDVYHHLNRGNVPTE